MPRRLADNAGRVDSVVVHTIGHSTRTVEDFVACLQTYGIELVVDVRRFPGSRRLPHFNAGVLEASLPSSGIVYRSMPSLGGRRRAEPDSPNTGWRHQAFRGYADHVLTEEFADGLFELLMLGYGSSTAIMCAELLWWRCHRRIIADVLTTLDVEVVHVRDSEIREAHRLTEPARLISGRLSYAEKHR